jgi:hypothetical protein
MYVTSTNEKKKSSQTALMGKKKIRLTYYGQKKNFPRCPSEKKKSARPKIFHATPQLSNGPPLT